MIAVSNISKCYDPDSGLVLDNITFTLNPGQTLSIIGQSGCGKTTLLHILAGLVSPTEGKIGIASSDGREGRPAMVFQDFGLFPWKTVLDNIALGPRIAGERRKDANRIAFGLMEGLGISDLSGRYPSQISGGQKQRVAIARALATNPDILLMDEPFSSLDAMTREHLQNLVKSLWEKNGISYIVVTHSVEEAVFMGQTIMVLKGRPGRISRMIENSGFELPDFRVHPFFFECVREIRLALETEDRLAGP